MDYKTIPGWFDFEAIYDQAVSEARDGDTLVEIGSWMGKSAIYLAQKVRESGKQIRVVCVDPWTGTPGHPVLTPIVEKHGGSIFEVFKANVVAAGLDDIIAPLEMPSVEGAKRFEDASVFMAFIDGDHSYEAVCADIEAWAPKVRPGGILAGHDYDRRDTVYRAVSDKLGMCAVRRPPRSWMVRVGQGIAVEVTRVSDPQHDRNAAELAYTAKRCAAIPLAARPERATLESVTHGQLEREGICLALNVKNEAAVVARAIRSAAPFVGGVVCVDTGSTDETERVVRETCSELGLALAMLSRGWRDFAWNQTALLADCAAAGWQYAWILDADEHIVQTGPLGAFDRLDLDGYEVCRIWAGDWEVWGTRIFRTDVAWHYEGARHAHPVGGRSVGRIAGLDVLNSRDGANGQTSRAEQHARFMRDVEHFQKLDDPRSRYYLAQSYHDSAKFAPDPGVQLTLQLKALEAYEDRAHERAGFAEEQYISALQVARYRERLRCPAHLVVSAYERAMALRPTRHEAPVELANLLRRKGRPELAWILAGQAAKMPPSGDRFLVQRSAYQWRPGLEFALAAWDSGDHAIALHELERLYERFPAAEVWRALEQRRTVAA